MNMTGELEPILEEVSRRPVGRVTFTTFHLFKSLLVDFRERVVLLFQFLQASGQRNGNFQIMMI